MIDNSSTEERVIEKKAIKKSSGVPSEKKGELKQRAYLNSISSIIDYAGAQLTGIIVSPFIVNGLGNSMYGIWQMLGQMTGYSKMADARATQALKWTVAKKQDIASKDELRSDVTSALVVTVLILPLVLIAGGVISWYAPMITKADPSYYSLIRITCSLLVLSLVIAQVFELFEAVLRGMNMGYKRMGFRAGIIIVGGGMKVWAITQGYGLIGLATVQIIITLITGITFYLIVKRAVGWFGFGKTDFRKVKSFGKLSGWYMANTATDTLLTHSDKVLLGFLASPVLVSFYALTTFLPLAVQGLIFRIIIGVIPGVGKLLGLKDYERINTIRSNLNAFIFLLTTASGVSIILFNESFLNVWVGTGHFAGNLANTLIILMIMQDTFIKHDGYVITATLDLKAKIFLTVRSLVLYIGLGFLLVDQLGVAGLCLSVIAGKFLLFIGQRGILQRKIAGETARSAFSQVQPLLISFAMLAAAYLISNVISPVGWVQLLVYLPVSFLLSCLLFFMAGLSRQRRLALIQTISSVRFFKSK